MQSMCSKYSFSVFKKSCSLPYRNKVHPIQNIAICPILSYERFPYSSYDPEHLQEFTLFQATQWQTDYVWFCAFTPQYSKSQANRFRTEFSRSKSCFARNPDKCIKVNAKRQYQESELDQQKKKPADSIQYHMYSW